MPLNMHVKPRVAMLALVVAGCVTSGCGASPTPAPSVPPAPPKHEQTQNQIISSKTDGTAKELFAKGEQAIAQQKWQDAVDAFGALLAAEPNDPHAAEAIYQLAFAHENLGDRDAARAKYRELVTRFPGDRNARQALQREANIDAYAEDWKALGEAGSLLLARQDADDIDRMTGLGARGLAKVAADDETGGFKDINDGLDLADTLHYGALGRLPVPVAQLRFGLAEVRRVRSEKIKLMPVTPDFVMKLELRCAGLLDAQTAYADAIRSVDPHWAAMSGYRVGEMYRTLHHELMAIPPTELAKTESDKQLFYAIMHVRYRALMEKGIEMMNRTLALAEKTQDTSSWVTRAKDAKKEMEVTLEEEKAQLAKLPFTEKEVEAALDLMKKKAEKKQAGAQKKQAAAKN
jgi:tetratricopeptide (TPR) repeat protein